MRLATFSAEGTDLRVGAVLDDQIADLTACDGGPPTLRSLLQQPDWAGDLAPMLKRAPRVPLDAVTLHSPVPSPSMYMAIGLNARDHRSDINARWLLREPKLIRIAAGYLLAHPRPKHPFFFAKAASSIVGPFDPIVLPRDADQVDWEGELAVIVGTRTHEVDVETARRNIAGFVIANDVSVRDWQTDNPTAAALAKGYPSHGPLGPWMVTADELDLADLELRTYLNGSLRQRGRIADLILSPAEIVSRLSRFCALQPGDVVACGTFAGTGWPAGRFLRHGDTVRIEVDGIGHLANPVRLA
jgi:2-keto-4-pentenoate hydratase/2-oxohepta-3-ene-1,7-dioic acid hydratase in catechol pathway